MCKYFNDRFKTKCLHKSLPDSEYCIFHLQDDLKDVNKFNDGVNKILESEDNINFDGFYFPPGTSDFSNRKFLNYANFTNAKFSEKANFRSATFSKNVIFHGATFSRIADFGGVRFSGTYADFEYVKFSGFAHFGGADFSGLAHFGGANFLGIANFGAVRFSGKANFGGVKFSGDADFESARFLQIAYFQGATFLGYADFRRVEIFKDTNFRYAQIDGKMDFIPEKNEIINFEHTYFSENIRVYANLTQCYFWDSNIERVDLTGSKWDRNIKKEIIIFEEIEARLPSKVLEDIYRRLKQSYQKNGVYSLAGEFYYREMECLRKQLKRFQKLFWSIAFKRLCGYGEKPFNVIGYSFLIIIVFAVIFYYNGIIFYENNVSNILINHDLLDFFHVNFTINQSIKDFLLCLYTSVITFTTLGYGDVHPIGWSRFFASVEAGIGIFMTALFIFVFTRKMLR